MTGKELSNLLDEQGSINVGKRHVSTPQGVCICAENCRGAKDKNLYKTYCSQSEIGFYKCNYKE